MSAQHVFPFLLLHIICTVRCRGVKTPRLEKDKFSKTVRFRNSSGKAVVVSMAPHIEKVQLRSAPRGPRDAAGKRNSQVINEAAQNGAGNPAEVLSKMLSAATAEPPKRKVSAHAKVEVSPQKPSLTTVTITKSRPGRVVFPFVRLHADPQTSHNQLRVPAAAPTAQNLGSTNSRSSRNRLDGQRLHGCCTS